MGRINTDKEHVDRVIKAFDFKGDVIDYCPYGSGHINDTFKVKCENANYILQRINSDTFNNPAELMKNIELVTQHIKNKMSPESDIDREVLQLIRLVNSDEYLYIDGDNYWRAYLFIEDSLSFDIVSDDNVFYQSGYAFGEFQYYLKDFESSLLTETIKDFHNTPERLVNLKKAIELNPCDRVKDVQKEIDFALEREPFTNLFVDLYNEGKLKKKVTHNDTKLNNVLFDDKTKKAICVIDLDTVMPGFVLDDFGDSIRFGASTALEDEKDLDKVSISLNLFDKYISGFLEGSRNTIETHEIELFPEASKMMTLECGMRFLTDYIMGDVYFKTGYPDHNLDRTRTQFKLVSDMESKWEQMKSISGKYL